MMCALLLFLILIDKPGSVVSCYDIQSRSLFQFSLLSAFILCGHLVKKNIFESYTENNGKRCVFAFVVVVVVVKVVVAVGFFIAVLDINVIFCLFTCRGRFKRSLKLLIFVNMSSSTII